MPLFLFVKYIELIFKKDNILVKIHKNTSLYKNNISTKINDNKNRGKKLPSGNLTFSDFKLLCT